jgi:RNA polymerase sigma factor (sigma-70 family)
MTGCACPPPQDARARVERLWPAARQLAAWRCGQTLYRLARGDGGFYDADDFWQDLFLEFWGLAQRPELATATWDDDALRTAWGKALWGGGLRILRRAPQRLWRRFAARLEQPVDFARLDPTEEPDERSAADTPLSPGRFIAEDGRTAQEALARLATLEAALAQLRPAQRQALYLVAIEGLPARAVAARLGLSSANAVTQRVSAARQRLAAGRDVTERLTSERAAMKRADG